MFLASLEYWVEVNLIPGIKHPYVTYVGIAVVVCGEILRKMGIITAKHNFTQRLQTERRQQHTLVTTGIYSKMRHTGYAGWIVWAVGTQLILVNPICSILFIFVVRSKE